MTAPRVLLSFDVEEFDLPEEYGGTIDEGVKLDIGRAGLEQALALLDDLQVCATLFVTARIAQASSDLLRTAAKRHEIASHGVRHDHFEPGDEARSRVAIEAACETSVTGFRMARLQPVNVAALREAGYDYDSSENPIRLPGRYDNRHLPRTPRIEDGLVRIPISTTPKFRVPLFWLAFRHMPRPLLRAALARTLAADGHLVLFFHPWELLDLRRFGFPMPRIVRHGGGERLARRMRDELGRLRDVASFSSMRDFAKVFREEATNTPTE